MATFSSNASAATPGLSYGYQGDIGTPESSAFYLLYNPVAVSKDDGKVFIARQGYEGAGGVEIVDPSGSTIGQSFLAPAPGGIAVSADGSALFMTNVYAEFFGAPVEKFVSDGAPSPTYTLDTSWSPGIPLAPRATGIAVDPSTGDVVVGAPGGTYRFDGTSGALEWAFDGSTTDRGPFSSQQVAVAPNGDVYSVAGAGRVERIGSDGAWKGELKVPDPDGNVPPSGIAVNPQNGDVAVDLPQGGDQVIKIYTAANELKDTIRVPLAAGAGENPYRVRGLAFAADGSKLYAGLNDGSAHVYELGTRPGVDAPTASDITTTGARLTAAVATAGESTAARIEYCLASDPCSRYLSSEGESPWHPLPDHTGLVGPEQESISDEVIGLQPNTKYLVRTFAVNDETQVESLSATASFLTAVVPPVVQTGAATGVTATTVELTGTIDAIGDQTTYHFEYGTTAGYGSSAPAGTEAIAGAGRAPRAFNQSIKGLQPGTTYHYRLVATNSAGTTLGEDRTFTTLAVDQVAPRRGYEQVTSTDKKGMVPFADFGFQAAPDGSAFVYTAAAAASDAQSAAQGSRYLSRRGPAGWGGQKPLDPPLGPVRQILTFVTLAVSDDFEHTMVMSQVALTPDAIEGAANIYVNDVDTGAYHLVGTTTQPEAFPTYTGPNTSNTFIAGAPDFSWVVLIAKNPLLPGAPQRAMYKWTRTDGLSLISLLPGDSVPNGNAWVQSSVQTTNRLVSTDGGAVAFSLTDGEGGVYRRAEGETEEVSVSQVSGDPAADAQPGTVTGMSRDGRYVFFHSGVQLTDSAPGTGGMLYRYDSSTGGLEYLGTLSGGDIDVIGIGDDGRTVYFNRAGAENDLVAWRDGQLDVVVPGVRLNGGVDGNHGYPSPNGRYLAFSIGRVIYLYDSVTGEQTCLTCRPDGELATGRIGGLPDRNLSNRFSQVVTDDGHAYFDANSPLLSADRNGTRDVYEYFRGRLTLVSPGARDFTAILADISSDGTTVFFTTAEGLGKADLDRSIDVYAARVGGGFPEPSPPVECSGEACREAGSVLPAAPSIGTSASRRSKQTQSVRCGKGTRKVRKGGKTRCVKKKQHEKKRTTKHNRRAGR